VLPRYAGPAASVAERRKALWTEATAFFIEEVHTLGTEEDLDVLAGEPALLQRHTRDTALAT